MVCRSKARRHKFDTKRQTAFGIIGPGWKRSAITINSSRTSREGGAVQKIPVAVYAAARLAAPFLFAASLIMVVPPAHAHVSQITINTVESPTYGGQNGNLYADQRHLHRKARSEGPA